MTDSEWFMGAGVIVMLHAIATANEPTGRTMAVVVAVMFVAAFVFLRLV